MFYPCKLFFKVPCARRCWFLSNSFGSKYIPFIHLFSKHRVVVSFQVLSILPTSCCIPCFSFQPEWFQILSCPLCPFLCLCNLPRFFGLTRLSEKQLSFNSSSFSFLDLGARSFCKWGRVVTARDRFSRFFALYYYYCCDNYLFHCIHHGIIHVALAVHCRRTGIIRVF